MKTLRIAFYGKGGIGKSTVASNCAAAFAASGLKVMQIGCDPKADSTLSLRHGEPMMSVLDLIRTRQNNFSLDDMVRIGKDGVICVEAGGPEPGVGCAGRGIIAALEKLREKGAYQRFQPDVILYDVLGDVVCGGFSMPMRGGYADKVFVITSGENMAIHAAANIAMAIDGFKGRGYAQLGGVILNRRNVKDEDAKVAELASDINSEVVASLSRSDLVQEAEDLGKTVVEAFPDSTMAQEYRALAKTLMKICGVEVC
jgi:nitrogenase iron protein NifH